MSEAIALNIDSEVRGEQRVDRAGLVTGAKEYRMTEVFRTNQININLPEDSSDLEPKIVFFAARI